MTPSIARSGPQITVTCHGCDGSGRENEHACTVCHGSGKFTWDIAPFLVLYKVVDDLQATRRRINADGPRVLGGLDGHNMRLIAELAAVEQLLLKLNFQLRVLLPEELERTEELRERAAVQ